MRLFKRILIGFFVVCLAGYLYVHNHYVIPILMYHSINERPFGTPNVDPKNFEIQMKYLKKNNYNVISLDELVSGIISNKKFKRNTVVITFDDGFKDNYINAYPILKSYKIPATIFLISDFIDKKQEHLNWQQVKEMSKNNICFGAHTRSHIYLPEVSLDIARQEIAGSKKQIESNLGQEVFYFAYPTGAFSEDIKNFLKKAGFKAACTTNRGYDKSNKDIFELKRIKITDKDGQNLFKFRMKLSGYYNLFRSRKNPS